MSDKEKKFEQEDVPRVLAALKCGHESGAPSRLIVDFSAEGSVIAIHLETKKKFK